MNLNGDSLIPHDAILTDGKTHDVAAMKKLAQESGAIYALDRGYVDYKSLYSIALNNSIFVTRMKSNAAFKRIAARPYKLLTMMRAALKT